MEKIFSTKIVILASIVFVVALVFAMFFMQNLPINFGDDINNIRYAARTPWSSVLKNLGNPITPALYVHSQQNLLTTKVFETFLLKATYSLFGLNSTFYYGLKALAFAIVSSLIVLMVYGITGNLLAAGGAGFFFITAPPTYRSVSLLTDFEIISQCLILVTLFIFFLLYFKEKRSLISFIILTAGMALSLWVGTRTRETARILPLLLTVFVIIDQRFRLFQWVRKSWRNIVLVSFIIFSFILIIPLGKPAVEFDRESHQAVELGKFSLDNVLKIVFYNPQGIDPEKTSAFLSRDADLPTTLARTFGFYLDWAFVLSLTVFFLVYFIKTEKDEKRHWSAVYPFLFFWSALICACFGLGFKGIFLKERYLLTAIVPSTLLVFTTFYFAGKSFPRWLRWIFAGVLIVLTLLRIQINFDHIIFLRNYYGGADVAEHHAVDEAYKTIYGKEIPTESEKFDFFRDGYSKYRIKDWDREVTEKTVDDYSQGKPYVFIESYKKKDYQPSSGIKLISECPTVNKSFYSQVIGSFKEKVGRVLYLYCKSSAR